MFKTFNEDFLKSEEYTIVKFGAPWCSNCVQIEPILEELEKEGYNVYVVDTDKDPNLTVKYQIRSVPTTIIFKNGNIVETLYGMQTKSNILDLINEV